RCSRSAPSAGRATTTTIRGAPKRRSRGPATRRAGVMTGAKTMPYWARSVLDQFAWTSDAAAMWGDLHRTARARLLAAARAEIAASRAYVRADAAAGRARRKRDEEGGRHG